MVMFDGKEGAISPSLILRLRLNSARETGRSLPVNRENEEIWENPE
jgi:hypothetical protein